MTPRSHWRAATAETRKAAVVGGTKAAQSKVEDREAKLSGGEAKNTIGPSPHPVQEMPSSEPSAYTTPPDHALGTDLM